MDQKLDPSYKYLKLLKFVPSQRKNKMKTNKQKTSRPAFQQFPPLLLYFLFPVLNPALSMSKPFPPTFTWAAYLLSTAQGENWEAHVNIFFLNCLPLKWNSLSGKIFFVAQESQKNEHIAYQCWTLSFSLGQYFRWILVLRRMEQRLDQFFYI